jgi:hypothetical protein
MERGTLLTAALMIASTITIAGQWPPYLPPNVPRTPAGTADLNAPAPRAPDGHIDLSGVWDSRQPLNGRFNPPPISSEGGPPVATFFNIAANMKDGGPPFTPWAAELRKQRMATNSQDNPDAHCLPIGLMQFHTHSQPRKIVQSPNVVVIIYEANSGLRQIFTDGRPRPDKDADPWWYGYSTGRWEGDTLVVETAGFRDDGWLDVYGAPYTANARITERFRRVNYGRLEIDVTIDDPKAYTRPWTVRVNQRLLADGELIEFVCNENERSSAHYVR